MIKKIIGAAAVYAVIYSGANIGGLDGTFSNAVREDKPMAVPAAKPGADPQAPRKMTENVVAYSTEDEALKAAKLQGRKTLPRFEKMLADGMDATFTVKFPLTQNGETEHIWLQVDGQADGKFLGRLANEPVNGTKYKMGQKMEVAKADVEDWMVRTGDGIWGGYSMRVMLPQLPEDQAAKIQAMLRD